MPISDRKGGYVRPGYDPLLVPNQPTSPSMSQVSSTSVSVAFTAPTNVGGGAITSYTVVATDTSSGATFAGTGSASPITITGLTTGNTYTAQAIANNAYGPSAPSTASTSLTLATFSQSAYTSAGTYSWVAPAGVTSVSVVCVGGGAGSGGGLGYKNNISVTAGNSYTVVVGQGIDARAYTNLDSYFVSTSTVAGFGATTSGGGSYFGTGGGDGGLGPLNYSSTKSGGGAGGYSGNGGAGVGAGSSGNAGSGGAGGSGGANSSNGGGGGGGVGILGEGSNGAGGTTTTGGGGGSGGNSGSNPTASLGGSGGTYGGGCGVLGGGSIAFTGANGAVRIIWPGNARSFPSTNTEDF